MTPTATWRPEQRLLNAATVVIGFWLPIAATVFLERHAIYIACGLLTMLWVVLRPRHLTHKQDPQ